MTVSDFSFNTNDRKIAAMSTDDIKTDGAMPKVIRTKDMTVEEHSLKDRLEVERAVDANTAAQSANFGIRFGQIRGQGPLV